MNRIALATSLLAFSHFAAAAPARDPKIMKLAKAALACPFTDGAFSEDCAAYKAWQDENDLFADGKGNDTIFAMLADSDEKTRALGKTHGIDGPVRYFSDKARASELFARAAKATDVDLARDYANYVSYVDADKMGLAKELRALAKHPLKEFRSSLTVIVSRSQAPTALEVERTLLEDSERDVRKSAISALSTGGITPGVEPVCSLLKKQLLRTDDLIGDALWAGSSSKCEGMDKLVLAELQKRTADPSKVTNAVGIGYSLAASGVCSRTKTPELKKESFAIGLRLTDAKVKDPNTRRAGVIVLADCDRASAVAPLTALAKDKDAFIAKEAAAKLAEVKR
jgi:hypothetical protein